MTRTRRATIAMLFVGLAIFSCLYPTQAMLPTLVEDMGMSPTEAAMTISAATGALAICVIPVSIISERIGRGKLLLVSTIAATLIGMLVPLAPNPEILIATRALQGAVIAGAPATAMAWISEELESSYVARAMGLYIAGTTIGGLTGRLIPTGLLELTSWRWALAGSSLVTLILAIIAAILLPYQQNFTPKEIHFRSELRAIFRHARDTRLIPLFIVAFVAMGTFVSLYNFLAFRLIDHFHLSPGLAGLVFLFYLTGTWSSARAGRLVTQVGHANTLLLSCALFAVGIALCMGSLIPTLLGIVLFTIGFFAAHSTASGWVGHIATHDRAEASSLYVFFYYLGSSILGALAGVLFDSLSWIGFITVYAALAAGIAALSWAVRKTG